MEKAVFQKKNYEFHKVMTGMVHELKKLQDKINSLKELSKNMISNFDFETSLFNYQKISKIQQIMKILEITNGNSHFKKVKRVKLYEDAKQVFPKAVFSIIDKYVNNQRVKPILQEFSEKAKYDPLFHIRKIQFDIQGDNWRFEAIDWGLVKKIIFSPLEATAYQDFLAPIKTTISKISYGFKRKTIAFEIYSSVRWRYNERFYGPH